MLTAFAILCCRGLKQVRAVALAGASVQLLLSGLLLVAYCQERSAGNTAQMLFQFRHSWFEALHIQFFVGVDGISVSMILLTSFVVLAGILVSWKMEILSKEFFFLLLILSAGAYGFSLSSNYNSRPRAAEVLVNGDAYEVIRRRETYEDLIRLESD